MSKMAHFDDQGASRMVDVGAKPQTRRTAIARAVVRMDPQTRAIIDGRTCSKGDVFEVARLAGIQAAKRTSDLVPLCHPLPIDAVEVSFQTVNDDRVQIEARVAVTARTGVEMEALTAVSVAALTVYDMCKSVDRAMVIEAIQLQEKTGGRSGHYRRTADR